MHLYIITSHQLYEKPTYSFLCQKRSSNILISAEDRQSGLVYTGVNADGILLSEIKLVRLVTQTLVEIDILEKFEQRFVDQLQNILNKKFFDTGIDAKQLEKLCELLHPQTSFLTYSTQHKFADVSFGFFGEQGKHSPKQNPLSLADNGSHTAHPRIRY